MRRGRDINRNILKKPNARMIGPQVNGTRNWEVRNLGNLLPLFCFIAAAASLSHPLLSFLKTISASYNSSIEMIKISNLVQNFRRQSLTCGPINCAGVGRGVGVGLDRDLRGLVP